MKHIKFQLIVMGYILFVTTLIYTSIAASVWQWRNPKANSMTVWSYFPDVIKFKKLEKFQ